AWRWRSLLLDLPFACWKQQAPFFRRCRALHGQKNRARTKEEIGGRKRKDTGTTRLFKAEKLAGHHVWPGERWSSKQAAFLHGARFQGDAVRCGQGCTEGE
ncbi:unnamed protein product, partial [Sphacelaria rigidula]